MPKTVHLAAATILLSGLAILQADTKTPGFHGSAAGYTADDIHIKNVTLEMSLKPFRNTDNDFIADVCREMYRQWWPLTRHADAVSVLGSRVAVEVQREPGDGHGRVDARRSERETVVVRRRVDETWFSAGGPHRSGL